LTEIAEMLQDLSHQIVGDNVFDINKEAAFQFAAFGHTHGQFDVSRIVPDCNPSPATLFGVEASFGYVVVDHGFVCLLESQLSNWR
jgi:hypothetical protein